MTILAIEFSSNRRSVAVARDGILLAESITESGRVTSAPRLIAHALAQAGIPPAAIDRLAVGIGPGSYTGIRRAIATVQGWHLAWGTPVVAIQGFEVLARLVAGMDPTPAWLVADAQRGEWATARCVDGRVQGTITLRQRTEVEAWCAAGERVITPDAGLGGSVVLHPTAAMTAGMALDARPVPPEELSAVYLREAAFIKAPPSRTLC
jgi:tRNA threonylcarbamoyladenosine biosynthesis protein TsaB